MNNRRELVTGLLAALVSIIIISGSLAISYAESVPGILQALAPTSTPTLTSTPTATIPTPRPGEPTLTPSLTPLALTPTSPSPTPFCQFPEDWILITIQPGDTLESLAETYHTTPDALMEANCLLIESLSPGSQLFVPEPPASLTPTRTRTPRPSATYCPGPPNGWVKYKVKPGDTLYAIGRAHGGVSVAELQAANCMGNTTVIKVGEYLWVPYYPTPTHVISLTPSPSFTPSPTNTPSGPVTHTPTASPSPTRTASPTTTGTAQDTQTPTATATPSATSTPTSTYTETAKPTATSTPTALPYP